MATSLEIGEVATCDCTGDSTSVGSRWKRWKTAFQFFIDGKGVANPKQKKEMLLRSGRMDVQEVHSTLPEGPEKNCPAIS